MIAGCLTGTHRALGHIAFGLALVSVNSGLVRAEQGPMQIPQPDVSGKWEVSWPASAVGPDGAAVELRSAKSKGKVEFPDGANWTGVQSLALRIDASSASYHRFFVRIEAPDKDNVWVSPPFEIDWRGIESLHVDLRNFESQGRPDRKSVRSISLVPMVSGYEDVKLDVGAIVARSGYAEHEFEPGFVFIDLSTVAALSTLPQWRAAGGIVGQQRWNAVFWKIPPDGDAQGNWIERPFGSDCTGFRALEFTLTVPPGVQWRPVATVDGQAVDGTWKSGAGGDPMVERLELPEDAKLLERLRLEFRNTTGAPAEVGAWAIAKTDRTGPWKSPIYPIPENLLRNVTANEGESDPENDPVPAPTAELTKDPRLSEELKSILEQADHFASADLVGSASALLTHFWKGKPTSEGLQPDFTWNSALETLASAYLITGKARYANATVDALLATATVPNWEWRVLESVPTGFRYRAPFAEEISPHFARAFAAVQHKMTPAQRSYVLRALAEKGLYPTSAFMRLAEYIYSMNQGLVFANSLGLGSLPVIDEIPAADALSRQAEDALILSIGNYILPDGGFPEGPAYFSYAMQMASHLMAALAQNDPDGFRKRMPEGFKHTFDYPWFTLSNAHDGGEVPDHRAVNINNTRSLPGFAAIDLLAAVLGGIYEIPAAVAWLQWSPPAFESGEIWPAPMDDPVLRNPLQFHFRSLDTVVMRDGIDLGDTLLFIQGGNAGNGGHTHYDRGALLIEAFGEHLGLDSGVVEYTDTRAPIMKSTARHPHTITFEEGQNQTLHSTDGSPAARVVEFLSSPSISFTSLDLTDCYPGTLRVVRDLFFIRPDLIVSLDWILAPGRDHFFYHVNSQGALSLEGTKLTATAQVSSLLTHFNTDGIEVVASEVFPTNFWIKNQHATLRVPLVDSEPFVAVHDISENASGKMAKIQYQPGGVTISKGTDLVELQWASPAENDDRASYRIAQFGESGLIAGGFVQSERADFPLGEGIQFATPERASVLFSGGEDRLVVAANGSGSVKLSPLDGALPPSWDSGYQFDPIERTTPVIARLQAGEGGSEIAFESGDWIVLGESLPERVPFGEPVVVDMRVAEAVAPLTRGRGGWVPPGQIPLGDAVAVFSAPERGFLASSPVEVALNGKNVTDSVAVEFDDARRQCTVRVPAEILLANIDALAPRQNLRVRAFGDNPELRNATASFRLDFEPDSLIAAKEALVDSPNHPDEKPETD